MGWDGGMGLWSLSSVLHSLKIIIEIYSRLHLSSLQHEEGWNRLQYCNTGNQVCMGLLCHISRDKTGYGVVCWESKFALVSLCNIGRDKAGNDNVMLKV